MRTAILGTISLTWMVRVQFLEVQRSAQLNQQLGTESPLLASSRGCFQDLRGIKGKNQGKPPHP